MMIFVVSFIFSACKAPNNKTIGTLSEQATYSNDVDYSYSDLQAMLGEGEKQKFEGSSGFRFTYVAQSEVDGEIVSNIINGLTNEEGTLFESSSTVQNSARKIVCIKNGNTYVQTIIKTAGGDQTNIAYIPNSADKTMKNYLNNINIDEGLTTPQSILNLINSEN